jgi:hypothetical protein
MNFVSLELQYANAIYGGYGAVSSSISNMCNLFLIHQQTSTR